ncbi:helix-turn-helix domain-containing protein [Actinomadura macra]|uniref:helix-turn-helix domain-containing protein n=1 Tax=Actinomadura macra TaxID=46164 RepID=UPI00082988A5|nr:helix-turn-helix transcriptional regulator [Actinomadura macra]
MPEGTTGSTVPRRQLGRYLRDLRGSARLTVKAAAEALEWSEAKMWRIETGQTSMRSLDVEQMCRVYGASPEATEALMALAKETKTRGWWQSYADVVNDDFNVYLGLEEAADHLCWYEAELVPGLFQTPAYVRTLIAADNASVGAAEIERRVQLRTARQSLLTRTTNPPRLQVVLNEAILHRVIGSKEIMASQLYRLAELASLPNVSLRVAAFTGGLHPGVMSGPFVLLEFPRSGSSNNVEPPTVYVDGFTGALYLDKPHEVERYSAAFTEIWNAALNEPTTQSLITSIAKELEQ